MENPEKLKHKAVSCLVADYIQPSDQCDAKPIKQQCFKDQPKSPGKIWITSKLYDINGIYHPFETDTILISAKRVLQFYIGLLEENCKDTKVVRKHFSKEYNYEYVLYSHGAANLCIFLPDHILT